jgi:hypothetical protein
MTMDSRFLTELDRRVLVADGGMGTALQGFDLTLDDFAQLEGCNEVLNDTRPDVVTAVYAAYLEAGSDAIETNTFGTNLRQLRRVRHPRPDQGAGREGDGAGTAVRRRVLDAGSAPVRARLDGAGHEAAHVGSRSVRSAA